MQEVPADAGSSFSDGIVQLCPMVADDQGEAS